MQEDVLARIQQLELLCKHADQQYQNEGVCDLTDAEYDKLYRELDALAEEYPEYISADSILHQQLYYTTGTPVEHDPPFCRITKAYTVSDIEKFIAWCIEKTKLLRDELQFMVQHKYDGVPVAIKYEKTDHSDVRQLQTVAFKGDGSSGEDVTDNFMWAIEAIPSILKDNKLGIVEVRGEVVIFTGDFLNVNEQLMAQGYLPYPTKRAAVLNILKEPLIEPIKSIVQYSVKFMPYACLASERTTIEMLKEEIRKLHFPNTERDCEVICGSDMLSFYYHQLLETQKTLPYAVDGVIIQCISPVHPDSVDMEQYPQMQVAWKFDDRVQLVTLLDIEVYINDLGVYYPRGITTPIADNGGLISRVNLHDFSFIEKHKLYPQAPIQVKCTGDTTPTFVRLHSPATTTALYKAPTECLLCNQPLVKRHWGGIACVNPECVYKTGSQFVLLPK